MPERVALYLQDAHDLRQGLEFARYAEQRGFEGNHEMDDWLQAEAEIDARFAARH